MNRLFTPGPIIMDSETLELGGRQPQYFRTPAFSRQMEECREMLRQAFDAAEDDPVVLLTASGTAGMEAAVANIFSEKDKLLVIDGGTFGHRFTAICAAYRIPHTVIPVPFGEAFDPSILSRYENSGYTGFLVNVCETSTGQLYPMEEIAAFCKRNSIYLIADAISSFLSDPFSMKELGCAAVITASQKGLGLSPGMAYIVVNKAVYETRVKTSDFKSPYLSFTTYQTENGQPPYTPAISIINQLYEKLQRVTQLSAKKYSMKNKQIAEYFRTQLLKKTGFTYLQYPLSNCVTPVYCKNGNARDIIAILRDEHGIYVTPTAGDAGEKIFRVAHMSSSLTEQDIDGLIAVLAQLS